MIAADEDALICDFAETYHIYDYQALPPETAGALAAGMRRDTRIMQSLSGETLTLQEILMAATLDATNMSLWTKTKGAEHGMNRPKSILEKLTEQQQKKDSEVVGFDTPEEFLKAYREIKDRINGN